MRGAWDKGMSSPRLPVTSVVDEAWYWPKCVLHSGSLCTTLTLAEMCPAQWVTLYNTYLGLPLFREMWLTQTPNILEYKSVPIWEAMSFSLHKSKKDRIYCKELGGGRETRLAISEDV